MCLQVDLPAHAGTSALISMFRGIGIESSMTSWGRGITPLGLYETCSMSRSKVGLYHDFTVYYFCIIVDSGKLLLQVEEQLET